MTRTQIKTLVIAATLALAVPLTASACPEKRTSDATPVTVPASTNFG